MYFTENKITIRSFSFLSEEDINSLIPHLGTRSVFNAMLAEWRQQGGDASSSKEAIKRSYDNAFEMDNSRSDVFAEPSIVKSELEDTSYWIPEASESTKDSLNGQNPMGSISMDERQSEDQRSEGERSMDQDDSMVSLKESQSLYLINQLKYVIFSLIMTEILVYMSCFVNGKFRSYMTC